MADETSNVEEAGATDAKPWCERIREAETAFEPWLEACKDIDKLLADLKMLAGDARDRSLQLFWANFEVMRTLVYARPPKPTVVPRFKDKAPVARKASELLERAITAGFETGKVHGVLKHVRDNLVSCGRGVCWPRYAASGQGDAFSERVVWEWLHRCDFLHEPARDWTAVGWVARGSWLTKKQGEKRFGKAWIGIEYVEDAKDTSEGYKGDKKARVWELWDRDSGDVIWLHRNAPEILDRKKGSEVFAALDGFFPCPMPAYSTVEPDSLIPVPDVLFWKDQLEEINALTKRIGSLTESLRLKGFYASGVEEVANAIERVMATGDDRAVLEGLSNFAAIGGQSLKDSIVWLPLKDVIEGIRACVELRKVLIENVYEITGISDIMRGATEATETLGAQQIKSQYGAVRIRDRQAEMVRVSDEIIAISGEIMAEQFQPKTLMDMSQMTDLPRYADVIEKAQQEIAQQLQQAPPDQQDQIRLQAAGIVQQKAGETVTLEAVMNLLRDQRTRPFVMQTASDSTIQPDENAEKQARAEFLTALSGVLAQIGPMIQAEPQTASFAGEILKFALAPFRVGRELEQVIEDFVEKLEQKAEQPPPPNPEMVKAEADAKVREMDMAAQAEDRAAKQQEHQAKQALAAEDAKVRQAEANARLAEIEAKAVADRERYAHEMAMQAGQERLLELQIALAEKKISEAAMKPKPNGNGNGEARP